MFEIYPGFEDLPIHVEVEWREQTRPIIARLEQWPESDKAVLVCVLEDVADDGEWLVIGGGGLIPYSLGNPFNLVKETMTYDVATRKPLLRWKRHNEGKEKICNVVHKAFGDNKNFGVGRLLHFDASSHQPPMALRTALKSSWMPNYSHQTWVEFGGQGPAQLTESQAKQQLRDEWNDAESEARFAWEWITLDDAQRKHHIGFEGDWNEKGRVIEQVLTASTALWQRLDSCSWGLIPNYESGEIEVFGYNHQYPDFLGNSGLNDWGEFLIRHFYPRWRADWFCQRKCVQQYVLSLYNLGEAYLENPPTAHEQIEAKLALRNWLRDAATPDVVARLLASLDD